LWAPKAGAVTDKVVVSARAEPVGPPIAPVAPASAVCTDANNQVSLTPRGTLNVMKPAGLVVNVALAQCRNFDCERHFFDTLPDVTDLFLEVGSFTFILLHSQ
jgi:hypothetical protein